MSSATAAAGSANTSVIITGAQNGKYRAFCNHSQTPFLINGRMYKTVEHWYQSQKFVTVDEDFADRIRRARSARDARALVLNHPQQVAPRSDWQQVKDDVMRCGLMAKFTQHPRHVDTLLKTGDLDIRDESWGTEASTGGTDGPRNTNKLGQLLVECRGALLKHHAAVPVIAVSTGPAKVDASTTRKRKATRDNKSEKCSACAVAPSVSTTTQGVHLCRACYFSSLGKISQHDPPC